MSPSTPGKQTSKGRPAGDAMPQRAMPAGDAMPQRAMPAGDAVPQRATPAGDAMPQRATPAGDAIPHSAASAAPSEQRVACVHVAAEAWPSARPSGIQVQELFPAVGGGWSEPGGGARVKRCVGDVVEVAATIFRDGHEQLAAEVRFSAPGEQRWRAAPLRRVDAERGGDRWSGSFQVDRLGRWSWRAVAWTDRFATWREELERKLAAGQEDVGSELAEGVALLTQLRERARGAGAEAIGRALALLEDEHAGEQVRERVALDRRLLAVCGAAQERTDLAASELLELDVEAPLARFGSWYELFPRSWGGLQGVRRQLPELARLGFDVLYLPPIHPIGQRRRRGRNDAGEAGPGEPGSPWAIGAGAGGHTAVHPELGTLADFDALLADAREHRIEIALDYALQCSADHPWLSEHPEWFRHRPDGTLKYAENPPKRYVDIYNFDFECEQWRSLWLALRDVMLFWVQRGVRVFRVDNPHTKPLPFWEWLIESVRGRAPETIFLSEAFTRAAMMQALAKRGFSQSYTYFTWKNSAHELREYVQELAAPTVSDFLRPNFFVNTPDILAEYLQHGGPPAFAVRLLLAATLSPSYGIYSGFERFEASPRHPGSEEYADSEKYELRQRALDGPLLPLVAALNAIRRRSVALQRFDNVAFLPVENDALIAYAKRSGRETLLVVVNVDPHSRQEGIAVVPSELGLPPAFAVEDLLSGERHTWHLGRNYVALDPAQRAGHLLLVSGD
ncbi:MAG: alpha-1,4-glucan--maltose-1-phosphate maltosyltransferase [Solirubrobacteraceae bacterium]